MLRDPFAQVGPTRSIAPVLVEQMRLAEPIARGNLPVLILGETGTGKEVVARQIHAWSGRKGEFRAVSCAAIPAGLIESELFGHRRGAFTDAKEDRIGLVEAASGGSLLVDEVGDLDAPTQVRLLRVLQDGEVVRLGETRPRKVDMRLMAATHRDLPKMMRSGRFREDLYARIAGFTLRLPPLRERIEDIGILLAYLLRRFVGVEAGVMKLEAHAMEQLLAHRWPFNVRELERTVEAALLLAQESGSVVEASHVRLALEESRRADEPEAAKATKPGPSDDEFRVRIASLLVEHKGNISAVARALSTSRTPGPALAQALRPASAPITLGITRACAIRCGSYQASACRGVPVSRQGDGVDRADPVRRVRAFGGEARHDFEHGVREAADVEHVGTLGGLRVHVGLQVDAHQLFRRVARPERVPLGQRRGAAHRRARVHPRLVVRHVHAEVAASVDAVEVPKRRRAVRPAARHGAQALRVGQHRIPRGQPHVHHVVRER